MDHGTPMGPKSMEQPCEALHILVTRWKMIFEKQSQVLKSIIQSWD
jgi:hypothetical protein